MSLIEILKNPPTKVLTNSVPGSLIPVRAIIDYTEWADLVSIRVMQDRFRCVACGGPTHRPDIDSLWFDDYGPFCLSCYCKQTPQDH